MLGHVLLQAMLEHVYVLVVSALDNIVTGHVYVIVRHCNSPGKNWLGCPGLSLHPVTGTT